MNDKETQILIGELWELVNKPWRAYRALAEFVDKYADTNNPNLYIDKDGVAETIAELRRLAELAGRGGANHE